MKSRMQPRGFSPLRVLIYAIIFSISATAFASAQSDAKTEIDFLKRTIKYLASDELEGRRSGSQSGWTAANFIAEYFRSAGIRPLAENYFQEFMVETEVQLAQHNEVVIRTGEPASGQLKWRVGHDYIPLAFSKDTTLSAELSFVGYGISSAENKYDDYQNIDVTGDIVIVFRGTPEWEDPHSDFSLASTLRYKTTTAREHGAVGIIFVNADEDSSEKLLPLVPDNSAREAEIIALHAKRAAIEALVVSEGTLRQLKETIAHTKSPRSFAITGSNMSVAVSLTHIEKPTANVIGWVPGNDPAKQDQYIVVGAHYDHLGWGGPNSRYEGSEPAIHHGADDNASGTAAMMALAARISHNPLPRPVVFMAFSGEELGLLGSSYYTKHPLIPLNKTVCMLNLDMVGRLKDNKLNVHGTGTSSLWEPVVDSLAAVYGLNISKAADGYGPSDHSSFYSQNVPVLFFFTGLHEDYHRPSDTWDKINYAGMETVINFTHSALNAIGSSEQAPDFVKVQSSQPRRAMAFRVYVGTIPDYSDSPNGMRLTGVREGSPAEKGGLQGGDILIEFGGIPIKNIYDYTYALGKFKPGDKVKVVVLRGGSNPQKVTLELELAARK